MAKSSGGRTATRSLKKRGRQDMERYLNQIRRQNDTIMKACRKLEELLSKAEETQPGGNSNSNCPPDEFIR